ncbi:MAG TPA: sensor histidine kinase [Cyanobacteria bacterium UBA8803]|nr:sensor histidine kinase [Cyanobacteria bacterium UBA9273]HBL61807.1 sensor histidine kinase [Cyanobacteria bacterium UBA8803]
MNPSLPIRPHPIRFLLYVEWILLGLIAASEFLTFPFPRLHRLPLLNLVCLGLFGVMGLHLPKDNQGKKVTYTALEIGLVILTTLVGNIRLFPLLGIIIVIRNCFIFQGASRFTIVGFTFLLFLLRQFYRVRHLTFFRPWILPERLVFLLLSSIVSFGLVLIVLQLLVDAILSERRSREELAQANTQLCRYALRIEDIATLQERNRIAREIHDSLGHSLTAFNLHLEAALRLLESNPAEAREFLLEAKQLGATALKEVRQSVSTLRSDPLQSQSLENAIASLTEEFSKSTGILPTCYFNLSRPVTAEVKTAIYRIVQESLTNICKYAAATEVEIRIETKADLQVLIRDNGRGFNLDRNTTSFGLQGMRERTQALGGSFKIVTAPAQGCQIIAHLPFLSKL